MSGLVGYGSSDEDDDIKERGEQEAKPEVCAFCVSCSGITLII